MTFLIRSDDEDEEYPAYCSDRQVHHQPHNGQYYVPDEFDELDAPYNSKMSQTVEESMTSKELSSHVLDQGFPSTQTVTKSDNEPEPDNSFECGAASSIYALESNDTNPVDFEKDELFWLPPEPEDEMEADLFDDDDDDVDDDDEFVADDYRCRIRSSSSFGSGEFRSRDRSGEEHKKVMKNVVDGHFRALISQLLQVENISVHEGDDDLGWLEIVTSVSWEAANFLRPDTSQGGGMDPGGYVKVKCLACGHRSER